MFVRVFVTIILSVQIVQGTSAFGVKIMNDVLTKMPIHLRFHMANVENGQQMNTDVELHQVNNCQYKTMLIICV